MALKITMPKLGMMEADIQLVEWKCKPGDSVQAGDALAVIESEKITNEIEAKQAGTVLKLYVEEGETVPIGTLLAVVGAEGEDISSLESAPVGAAKTPPPAVASAPVAIDPSLTQITMPKLGMMEADIQLVEWKKNEGDKVAKGDAVAGVESEKITNDIESKADGVLLKILVPEGETVPIGTLLAVIGAAGTDVSSIPLYQPGAAQPAAASAPVAPAVKKQAPVAVDVAGVKSSPAAKKLAAKNNVSLADVASALNLTRRLQVEDVQAFMDSGGSAAKVKASPAAKKLADKNKISLADVASALSLTRRLQVEDVQAFMDSGGSASGGEFTETKLVGMRRTIADRMAKSSNETAAITLMRSVDVTAFQALRNKKKEEFAARGEKAPSHNDLIIKATALALEKHPGINATFENNIVRTYKDININMAIAIPAGLITPVIHKANKLSVVEISAKAKELADKANNNKLTPTDLQGGTFTVTNLGMLDIEVSTPIINLPQVAILAVGTVQSYLAMEEGKVVERFKTYFSLSVDHRIIDGYPGAQFLYTLAEILQAPEQLW